jgi:DNA-binding LacI/PurR family transcriptional regulator/transposase-like protein
VTGQGDRAWTPAGAYLDGIAADVDLRGAVARLVRIVDPVARVKACDRLADRARDLQHEIGQTRRQAVYEATIRPGATGQSVATELGVSPKAVSAAIGEFRAGDRELLGAALRVLIRPGVSAVPRRQLAAGLRARDVLTQATVVLAALSGHDASQLDRADAALVGAAQARAYRVRGIAGVDAPAQLAPDGESDGAARRGGGGGDGDGGGGGRTESPPPPRRAAAPSIRDVAAAAGVSYQTVSRVVNDSPRVSPQTRRVVLDAIDRLGFRPNRAARALGLGRATAVTVVTSDTMLYGYACTLQGVEEAARLAGLAVGVRVVESDSPHDIQQAVEYLGDPSAGGVVVIAFDPAGRRVLETLPADVPAVAAIEPAAGPHTGRVAICLDERAAAAEATRHLLSLGHRTVHHVAIPSEAGTSGRQAGWLDALRQAGAPIPAVVSTGWEVQAAYRAGQRLAADAEVTAVLCGNDDLALGVRRALYEAGRDVPGAVSVVGFDDIPGAALWTPALTTVRMDFVGLGRACFAAVWAELRGQPDPQVALTPPRLVIRESTAPPRSRMI